MARTETIPTPRRLRWPGWVVGGLALGAAGLAEAWGRSGAAVAPLAPLAARVPHAADLAAGALVLTAAASALVGGGADNQRTLVGHNVTFPWTARRLSARQRLGHVACLGQNGSGRAGAVMAPLLASDLASGVGVTVIEVRGGPLRRIGRTVAERVGRPVVEWEPGAPDSACWNPLAHATPAAAERFAWALRRLAGGAAEPQPARPGADTVTILRQSMAAFASAGEPCDACRLREFLTDVAFRSRVLAAADAAAATYFRTVFDAWRDDQRSRACAGVLGPLQALLSQPFVRRALCPPPGASTIEPADCLSRGEALFVSLPLGSELRLAEALGGLVLAAFQAAAYARGADQPQHFLYLDECRRFVGPGFPEFLAQAGGLGVGAVLGHAALDARGDADAGTEAGLPGAATAIILRCDGADAEALAARLPPRGRRAWNAEDLTGLPFGCAVMCSGSGARTRAARIRLRVGPTA